MKKNLKKKVSEVLEFLNITDGVKRKESSKSEICKHLKKSFYRQQIILDIESSTDSVADAYDFFESFHKICLEHGKIFVITNAHKETPWVYLFLDNN